MNADANNRQLHPSEIILANELAQKSKGKYTAEEIQDALRNSGNKDLNETLATGMVTDVTSPNAGVYDSGAKFNAGSGAKNLVQILPNGGAVDPELAAFIQANTGVTDSAYGWNNVQLGKVEPPKINPNTTLNSPTPSANGCITAECAAGQIPTRPGSSRDPNDVRNDVANAAAATSRAAGVVASTATVIAATDVEPLTKAGAATTAAGATVVGFISDVIEQAARPDQRKFFIEQLLIGVPADQLISKFPLLAPVINEAAEMVKNKIN